MKKISIVLIAGFFLVTSCNNNDNKKDSVDAAKDANEQKDTTSASSSKKDTLATAMPVNEDVANFAVKAANGGMMEVEMGKLAEERASSKSVKDFGARMVKDHEKLNAELKSLAAEKNITLPATMGDDMQKKMDDMRKDSTKFDKDYIDKMVSDHKDDIDLFEKNVKDSKDSTFKNFAVKALPTLYKHLGAAKAIQKSRK
jgi:putative membrane protein